MGFFISVEGDVELRRALAGLSRRTSDLKPAFKVVADNMRAHTKRQFQTGGREGGAPWRPLSAATRLARRMGRGYYRRIRSVGSGPLVASARLRRSFTEQASAKHVEDIKAREMEWGSKHPLAHLHAQGVSARGPAPPLPKRELIAFRDAEQRRKLTVEPLRKHVLAGLSRGVGR